MTSALSLNDVQRESFGQDEKMSLISSKDGEKEEGEVEEDTVTDRHATSVNMYGQVNYSTKANVPRDFRLYVKFKYVENSITK